jgi:hypothetical protein
MKVKTISYLLTFTTAAFLANCGKKTTEEDVASDDDKADLAEVEDVSQLGLSGALNISMPEALDQTESTGLRLAASKRSREACRIGSTIKEVTEQINSFSSFLCHLEVEKDKIKFGTKYRVMFDGKEFGRVWPDNSKVADGQITLYMCKDGYLKERTEITAIKKDADGNTIGAKGQIQNYGKQDAHSWKSFILFDAKFTGDSIDVEAEQAYADEETNGSFVRAVLLKLFDKGEGITSISLASKGTWQGSDFADRGYGLHDGDHGHILFNSQGSYDSQPYDFSRHSYFEGKGEVVSGSSSAKFDLGAELAVTRKDLPDFLSDSFSPDAPEGWECDYDETIELNPDSKEHQTCDSDRGEPANCWDDNFDDGESAE